MKANETTLGGLLQGQKQFVVPLYQRRYSWDDRDDKKPLTQLWSDLCLLLDGDGPPSHFLGSVVLAPSPATTPGGVQQWLVVDGQQRLTTLNVLLCAIRDHVAVADPALANKIDDLYLVNKYANDPNLRYTLLPTLEDRTSWVALVERYPDAGGDDLIGRAYRYFRAQLVDFDDPDDQQDVRRLEEAINGKLDLVEIAAHADDNVYRIFESLNYKGQPLTQADLVRNYVFMRLPERGEEVHRHQWLPLQNLLADRELEELVWLELVLTGDDRATQEAVYRRQQQRLDAISDESGIERWVIELHRKARLFHRVLHPADEPEPAIRRMLERLDRWGTHTAHPIVLHVLLAVESGDLAADEAAAALQVVEGYLVRRMITAQPSNNLNRILTSLVKDLDGTPPTADAICHVLSARRKRYPTDAELREAVRAKPFYLQGRSTQRKFVLRALEEGANHLEQVAFDDAELTVEHVMPQSITDEWRQMLNDGDPEEDPDELHETLVQTLGNLTLTAYNDKLSNHGFLRKKAILLDSGLAMNRQIGTAPRWSGVEIRNRAEALADLAIALWPGPDESVRATPANPQWVLLAKALTAIPTGRWTSYLDLAELIGSHQVAVGAKLSASSLPNAYRVLKRNGRISPEFRWPDPDRTDEPRAVLEAEGVEFSDGGQALEEQRISAAELAEAIGLSSPD